VIYSNDIEYEFDILGRYFSSDTHAKNLVFVYSQKSHPSADYTDRLFEYGRKVILVPFEEYNKIEYASAIESLNLTETVMIIKDLRHMLKRLDQRLSMMQIKHVCYKKIIIDTVPFVVNMWKFYFPYSFFDKTILGYSHSYAFEAAVRNYEDDNSLMNPYDPVALARKVYGVTYINYEKVFSFRVSFKEYQVTEEELIGYEELKNKLFDSETSIKRIITGLHRYAGSLRPGYNVPLKLGVIYEWGDSDIVIYRTNLKVDTYLCSELMKLIDNSNLLAGCLCGD
jgi:hypothetical protein